MVVINYYDSGGCLISLSMCRTGFQNLLNARPTLMLPFLAPSRVLFSLTYYKPPLGGFAPHILFLYSETHSPFSPLFPIGSGNFETNLYLYKYPSNLVPVILPAYTTYENGTDRVFRNVST